MAHPYFDGCNTHLSSEECVNLEEYFLLWVNIPLQESDIIQNRLRSSINYQKLFNAESECEQYISHNVSKDDRIIIIISATNISQHFLLHIDQLRQVLSIYVRCSNEKNNEELNKMWFKQVTKIRGVFADIEKLVAKIEFDQNQRRNRDIDTVLPFNICNINNERSSSDLNAEFLHSLLIMDVLLRMQNSSLDSNKELITLCKKSYKDNPQELINIEKFALTYSYNQALLWYTSNIFLYRILNKAFRVSDIHLLYLLRSFIYDLYVQLQQCQCTSFINVYRGQLMTSDELDHLCCSIGQFISMRSFFSTSLDRNLAIFCLGSSEDSLRNLKRILFEIDADPQIDGIKPFAKIGSFSAFPNEEEVLFMPQSIFQLINISFDQQNKLYIIQMVLCGEKQNPLISVFEQNRKHYGGGLEKETNAMTLGNVLQRMGKCDDAEMFYRRQLNELCIDKNNDRLTSVCYFNIGEVLREKGQYDTSFTWYQKSLDIDIKILQDGHLNIGNTYNSIGIVQEKKGDFESALDSYSIALNIALKTFGWDHTTVAMCLNNTGNAYQAIGNYLEALDCHRLALIIRQKNLPPDHHRLGASHNNIGVIYHRICHFDLAYEHYQSALRIGRKSLPSYHFDITIIVRNIGLLYESKGDFKKALVHFEQEANHRRRILPSDHAGIMEIEEDIERINSKLL